MPVELPEMPNRMKHLSIDPKWKLPVPWFVQWIDGKPIFPVMDRNKWHLAVRDKLCWVCGQKLNPIMAFVIGPMCGINRTSAEPPCHLDCAIFSAENCPFLTKPNMKRMDCSELPTRHAPGEMLMRNPGCCGVWSTKSYEVIDAHNGKLIKIGEPTKVQWFAEGRKATRDEVMASINSGLPALQQLAKEQSMLAEEQLILATEIAMKFLPA